MMSTIRPIRYTTPSEFTWLTSAMTSTDPAIVPSTRKIVGLIVWEVPIGAITKITAIRKAPPIILGLSRT